jgi:cytochrome o ubiquinol oxidase operon protein cyoD
MNDKIKKVTNPKFGSAKLYVVGFIISLLLTFEAYVLTIGSTAGSFILVIILLGLALIQLMVQLFCFLHVGQDKNPKWNLQFFVFTFLFVLLVIIGSIWIMYHLNYNMSPEQINNYLQDQQGF